MPKSIFREASLKKLNSPEQLDRQLIVVSPTAWITIIAITLLVVGVVIWGFLGNIPEKVTGTGIIMYGSGITSVHADTSQKITEVNVSVGSKVQEGQVLAKLSTSDYNFDRDTIVESINCLQNMPDGVYDIDSMNLTSDVYSAFSNVAAQIKELEITYLTKQQELSANALELQGQISQAQASVNGYQKQLQDYRNTLRDKGIKDINVYVDNNITQLQAQIKEAQTQLNVYKATLANNQKNVYPQELNQYKEQIESYKAQFDSIKRTQLETLNESLETSDYNIQKSTLTAPISGTVLEISFKVGDYLETGSTFCRIVKSEPQTNDYVSLYVSADGAKKLHEGMQVHIYPSGVSKEEYGYVEGEVVSVADYPSTSQSIMNELNNENVVQAIAYSALTYAVKVNIEHDPSTISGFKWSSKKGETLELSAGTTCTADIVTESKRPVEVVMPFMKKLLPS